MYEYRCPACETRFEDVRVPVANVVGEIGGGWGVAKALLGFERNMIADTFGASRGPASERRGSRLANLARQHGLGGEGEALSDAVVRGSSRRTARETSSSRLVRRRRSSTRRARR